MKMFPTWGRLVLDAVEQGQFTFSTHHERIANLGLKRERAATLLKEPCRIVARFGRGFGREKFLMLTSFFEPQVSLTQDIKPRRVIHCGVDRIDDGRVVAVTVEA